MGCRVGNAPGAGKTKRPSGAEGAEALSSSQGHAGLVFRLAPSAFPFHGRVLWLGVTPRPTRAALIDLALGRFSRSSSPLRFRLWFIAILGLRLRLRLGIRLSGVVLFYRLFLSQGLQLR